MSQVDAVTQRWIKNPSDQFAISKGCYFDLESANRAVEFIETFCRLSGEGGEPFILLEWQKERLIMPIFGWMRADGTRRFREVFACVAKKNGKSTLASAIELYLLIADGEHAAEVYTAAVTKDQANIVHREAAEMVRASPELAGILTPIDHTKTIRYGTNAWIRALASDGDSAEGFKSHGLVIDEYHAWKNLKFYNSIRWSMAARKQPMTIIITTVGETLDSLCGQKYLYAKKVLRGEVEDIGFFALIFEPEEDQDFDDPKVYLDVKNWYAANPSLGHTISLENFEEDLKRARDSVLDWAAFKRYRFNLWTSTDQPWVPMGDWHECKRELIEQDFYGLQCFSGLDLSATQDTTALLHVFDRGDEYCVLPRIWVPQDRALELAKRGRKDYLDWIKAGYMYACPGSVIDYNWVMNHILEDAKRFNIHSLGFDRWGATQISQQLIEHGVNMVEFGQGYKSMSSPCKEFYRLIKQHRLIHPNNPAYSDQISNVVVQEDESGNLKPAKNKSKGKIDAVVATIMALGMALEPVENFTSSYESEGLTMI